MRVVVEGRDGGVRRGRLAEQPGEGHLAPLVEMFLAAEEDHLVGEQGVADLGGDVGGQVAAEPHAGDLGADAARYGGDVQG